MEEDTYQLTSLQEGILFEHLHRPRAGVDIEQVVLITRERLDEKLFQRAWQNTAKRHAVLRTRFCWEGLEAPQQVVLSDVPFPFEYFDWSDLRSKIGEQNWTAYLQADRVRSFQIDEVPLTRVATMRMSGGGIHMCWTFHHLLLDARGIAVVLKEVFAHYEALLTSREPGVDPVVPFRRQIDWLYAQDFTRSESFWRKALAGFGGATPLLAAYPVATEREMSRGEKEMSVSHRVTARLKALASRNGVTLNTVVQGVWALLLSRYSGESDVVFGAIRAARRGSVEGAESIVGLCISNVPVRVRVSNESQLIPWLKEIRDFWVALREHEHVPLVMVQGWSEVPPGTALFNTFVNFQDPSWEDALKQQGGVWKKREFSIISQPGYPLSIDAYGSPELRVRIYYDRCIFDGPSIERMLGHWRTLLESIAENPDRTLRELPILNRVESRQILVEWNRTAAKYPGKRCIHELFQEQVKRTPQAAAVLYGTTQLTYQKLNYRANRIANFLRSRGVTRGTMVGICLERSVDMVAAMLGILKAGGAYVPLDPDYPRDRLAFMLSDAKVPVLLISERLRDCLPDCSMTEVFCLDRDWNLIRQHSSDPVPDCGMTPEDMAYVIYTSGSTGTPKGVCVPHLGVVRLVRNTNYIDLGGDDRVAQAANASFDAVTFEIWGALLNGAQVIGIPKDVLLSPEDLARQIRDRGITTLFLTTALFNQLAREAPGAFVSLRHLLFGGEAVDPACVRTVLQNGAPKRLLHVYGPTETTTFATWFHVTHVAEDASTVPIGRPISNTEAYILDREGTVVPVGAPGELYLGGDGVARGYLNRPELTAEKFVPDTFSGRKRAKLYRTGDLVRWGPDGNIEFLGRIDHQVKVRGFRIELGEIEAVFLQNPMVREAVVLLREDTPGDKRLVAYLVPENGMEIRHPRSFLSERLPDYMVPSTVLVLPSLPWTPNGKVDRHALPKPERSEVNHGMVAPSTAMEEKVAEVWCDVLGLSGVSVNDNFFELGGHSLKAMQVMSRLRAVHKVDMPIKWLFEHPTVALLSAKIAEALQTDLQSEIPPILPAAEQHVFPLSFFQERVWGYCQNDTENRYSSLVALKLNGPIDLRALKQSLNEIFRRHAILRTTIILDDGKPLQKVHPPEEVNLRLVDLTQSPMSEEDYRQLYLEEQKQPFDPRCDRMMRVSLLCFTNEYHELQMMVHHLLYDSSLRDVFYRELQIIYSAFYRNGSSPLPELPIQYGDFAVWQHRWLQPGTVFYDRQVNFWKKMLEGAPPALKLSFERSKPEVQNLDDCIKRITIEGEPLSAIRAFSRKEGVTVFMTVLAAINVVLRTYASSNDMVVGTYLANRGRLEMEQVLGPQTNLILLRTEVPANATFRGLVRNVRQVLLEAQSCQDVPHNMLEQAFAAEGRVMPEVRVLAMHSFIDEVETHMMSMGDLKMERFLTPKKQVMPWGLTLQNVETVSDLRCVLVFNTDLYEPAATREMFDRLCQLLQRAVLTPDSSIETLFQAACSLETKE